VSLLERLDGFQSAQDLHVELKAQGERVGLATVYRGLQNLAENGEVDVLRNDNGEATYRLCSSGHHHHLVCRRCGRTVEIDSANVEEWMRETASRHGFVQVSHAVELFGLCEVCANEQARSQRS
jgi:Fur family ferric uptake transcriptional regulator